MNNETGIPDFCPQISRRDYFAAMAMQALVQQFPNPEHVNMFCEKGITQVEMVTAWALQYADAMIEALDSSPGKEG